MNDHAVPTISIDMDKPCTKCGVMGAMQNGICLECATDAIGKGAKKDVMRFIKIKVKSEDGKNRIHLEFERPKGGDYDQYMLNSIDAPAPSFHDALQALAQDVVELCELPDDYWHRIIVKGVSFSYGGEQEVMGATITATMRLMESNAPLNLNTPHKAEEPYAETGDPKQLLDPACARRLHMLIIEAEQFVKGVRQQIDAFAGAPV